MRVLLDECIPRRLKYAFTDHYCLTVPEAGLAGQKNGRLLSPAENAGFDLFFRWTRVFNTSRTLPAGALPS